MKIRRKVFETNSSSSHSLVIDKDTKLSSDFFEKPEGFVLTGKLRVQLRHYGREENAVFRLEDRVSYLICGMIRRWEEEQKEWCPSIEIDIASTQEQLQEIVAKGCGQLRQLMQVLEYRLGVKDLEFWIDPADGHSWGGDDEPKMASIGVDHQSEGEWNKAFGKEYLHLENVLFNPKSFIEVWNDESSYVLRAPAVA